MGARIERRMHVPARATRRALLRWYEPRRTAFPWRRGVTPYRVLVSEIMLQQTQAPRVVPAYRAFLRRFPSVRSLADAPRGEVLAAWSGLGYNRRAVALQDAARGITALARFPRDIDGLRALPGVGPYTASAVASIAFAVPVPAIDVNVRRVIARSTTGTDAAEADDAVVTAEAARLIDPDRPGDWNQALMDLGREVCSPRAPRCEACPLERWCRFAADGGVVAPPARRQPAFEGSDRQARGAVIRVLTRSPRHRATLATICEAEKLEDTRVAVAVAALAAEGMVGAGPAALRGSTRGSVWLAG